ncbi:MAG: hypothetical protein ACR2HS_06115 [Gammaproteobacteria bacterium]
MQNRKYIYSTILNIESLKRKYEYTAKDIIRATSQDEYEQTIKHYDKLIASLNKELLLLPIGYKYTGVFYIKNSYNIPATFEKHDGVVFMREDLVSWQIQEGLERQELSYRRNIYKKPCEGGELRRENAEPVYAEIIKT